MARIKAKKEKVPEFVKFRKDRYSRYVYFDIWPKNAFFPDMTCVYILISAMGKDIWALHIGTTKNLGKVIKCHLEDKTSDLAKCLDLESWNYVMYCQCFEEEFEEILAILESNRVRHYCRSFPSPCGFE